MPSPADIFIESTETPKPNRRKTKKEMSDEEYIRVCEKMAQLRQVRKGNKDQPKPEKPVKEKEVIKYVDRPVEVIKEVPEKPKSRLNLFDQLDNEDLKKDLAEVKSILTEMKTAKLAKQEAKKKALEAKPAEPAPKPAELTPKTVPTKLEAPKRLIYTGPMGLFKPF